jgi:ABC-type Na+ transport system ATPase subunit NatA
MVKKVIVPLTPGKVEQANKRLERLHKKLEQLESWHNRIDDYSKSIRSTKVAIKRWEDILAGKPIY